MKSIDIRLRWSCPQANRGGDAYRDEDAHLAQRQAFGVDDIDSPTHYAEQPAKTLFLVWVTLTNRAQVGNSWRSPRIPGALGRKLFGKST